MGFVPPQKISLGGLAPVTKMAKPAACMSRIAKPKLQRAAT